MPQNMKGFIVGSLFPFAEDEHDLCRVELKTAKPEHQDHAACSLMLDYFLAKPQTVSATEVQTWIEKAHENLETTFEGCITKGLRAPFVECAKRWQSNCWKARLRI